jgi:4-azaleucine resistance transporter AzlC
MIVHHVAYVMTARDDFVAGVRTMAPVLPGIVPFTLIFGVVAVSVGITPLQAVAMSVVLFAGTSQLAAIELVGQHAPAAVVVLTVVVINLRVVMYSASMAPYFSDLGVRWRGVLSYLLTDHVYALAITEAEITDGSASLRWYFLGLGTAIWVAFQAGTVAGVVLGATVPDQWGLEFIIPLTFLAILVPEMKERTNAVVAVVAGAVAVVGAGLPVNLGLFVAAVVGVLLGAVLNGVSGE